MHRLSDVNGGNGASTSVLPPREDRPAETAPDGTIWPEAGASFVTTEYVAAIVDRAVSYLSAGYPVHFSGPAGTGKTTIAFHVASLLKRPVTLIHGDDEFGSSDLIGGDYGYKRSRLVDNFIHSVLKTEETASKVWVDNRLTTACRRGDTLIYDEFTRSRPEANNVLLSILAEKLLNLPKLRAAGEDYLDVHTCFHAVFTSNPEEYAGVHPTQDALLDRLVTIRLEGMDRETEVEITTARSGIARDEAEVIVDLVRSAREPGHRGRGQAASVRASIALARILVHRGAHAHPRDPFFRAACADFLGVKRLVFGTGRRKGKGRS